MRIRTRSVVPGLLLLLAAPGVASASDHRDAPTISEDASCDLADLFAFKSPERSERTVLALTVNPFTMPGVQAFFSPYALYELRIDNDGDAVEDLVIQASFTGTGPRQTVAIRGPRRPPRTGVETRAIGGSPDLAGGTGAVIEGPSARAFAGLRDDPFFFDFQALFVQGAFRVPGIDFYAGTNVSALVVEVETASLLATPPRPLRIWATASRRVDGRYVQQDRVGTPTVNVLLVPSAFRDAYNQGQPRRDLETFAAGADESLQGLGVASEATRQALARAVLPDALQLDTARPSRFPSGRLPGDDVIDGLLGLLAANGAAVPTDPAGARTDHVDANDVPFLPSFPYLAPPHAPR
jgi:hypothetical protein